MQLKKKRTIAVIAHRGYNKKYPENTLLSFEKAIEADADYIELDVHLTSDGEIVVIHDGSTKRVGDKEFTVNTTDLKTLKTVDVGEGQTIPTLQEVFDLCKGKIGVQIEIKDKNMAEKVVKLVEENEMVEDVLLSSFIHSEMKRAKEVNPQIKTATLEPTSGGGALKALFARKVFIKNAMENNADAIHPFFKYVNAAFCKEAHAKGLLVNPWTVDSEKSWKKLIESGVDAIITNDPEGLVKYLDSQ